MRLSTSCADLPNSRTAIIADSLLQITHTAGGLRQITHAWPTDTRQARDIQQALRPYIDTDSALARITHVAGVDIGFENRGHITRAAAVVINAETHEIVETALVRQPTRMPYIPGLLSFREVPAGLAALADLKTSVDLVMVDGHGIAHPRRLGVATHLGLVSGLPTIGVAKKRLTGRHAPVGDSKLSVTPLLDQDECIGHVLRSRLGVKPIFISPGHRVRHEEAVDWVMLMLSKYKLPEPTRQADKLASRRDR